VRDINGKYLSKGPDIGGCPPRYKSGPGGFM
jgi:hypothetical protein